MDKKSDERVDQFIDITGDVCPMTFVRTKLKIESMDPGQILEVRLKGREPLENVPRSAIEHGHTILALEPEDKGAPAGGVHHLLIRKSEA